MELARGGGGNKEESDFLPVMSASVLVLTTIVMMGTSMCVCLSGGRGDCVSRWQARKGVAL